MPEVEDVKVDVLDSATGNVVVSVITDKQGTYKVTHTIFTINKLICFKCQIYFYKF